MLEQIPAIAYQEIAVHVESQLANPGRLSQEIPHPATKYRNKNNCRFRRQSKISDKIYCYQYYVLIIRYFPFQGLYAVYFRPKKYAYDTAELWLTIIVQYLAAPLQKRICLIDG